MEKKQKNSIETVITKYEKIKESMEQHFTLIKNQIKEDIIVKIKRSEYNQISKKIMIFKAVQLLVQKGYFIKEIAQELNLSTSSVQRYLNNPIIEEELGEEVTKEIKRILTSNLYKGKIIGGTIYAHNNEAVKLENGKFAGSTKK